MRRVIALGFVLMPLCLSGCHATTAPRATVPGGAAGALLEVAPPRSPAEAALLIREANARVDAGDRAGALPLLRALLRCDLLTDHGRVSLYALTAEAALGVDRDQRKDALAGFLVAVSVLEDDDPDLRRRAQQARAALLAMRVRDTALGTDPERPIVVENYGAASDVVAALDCGKVGEGRYVERRLPQALAQGDPAPRRLLCTENGDELTLWFSLAAE